MTMIVRAVVDDVRSLMQFTGCLSSRGHEPQEAGVQGYWLCPHCGLQVRWPCPEEAVRHTAPGEQVLDNWSKR
jgi:hypothetical protein